MAQKNLLTDDGPFRVLYQWKREIGDSILKKAAHAGAEWQTVQTTLKASIEGFFIADMPAETLQTQFDLKKQVVEKKKEHLHTLQANLIHLEQTAVECNTRFWLWLSGLILLALNIAEMITLPYLISDSSGLPLSASFAFAFLAPSAAVFVKVFFYQNLTEGAKARARVCMWVIWAISLTTFCVCLIYLKFPNLSMSNFSLDPQGLSFAQIAPALMIMGAWFCSLTTNIGLGLVFTKYLNVKEQQNALNSLIDETKANLSNAFEEMRIAEYSCQKPDRIENKVNSILGEMSFEFARLKNEYQERKDEYEAAEKNVRKLEEEVLIAKQQQLEHGRTRILNLNQNLNRNDDLESSIAV